MGEVLVVFFFFQAEDGIRDDLVTGVQTCALPICARDLPDLLRLGRRQPALLEEARVRIDGHRVRRVVAALDQRVRSEERRVGKEWRSRWWRWTQQDKEQ